MAEASLPKFFDSYCRWVGRAVYGAFLPTAHPLSLTGAENYLVDVWRVAPKKVAIVHTLLATLFLFLPIPILGKLRLLPQLSAADRGRFQTKMIRSRSFFLRTLLYGIRGHALVAILRDPGDRKIALRPLANAPARKVAV